MQKFSDLMLLDVDKTAVSIGKYDALHLGHQHIIKSLVSFAHESSLPAAVVTFDRHPNHVLKPDQIPEPVLGNSQREEIFEQLGVDILLQLKFTEELANLSAENFVQRHLIDGLHAQKVFVGEHFRFGHGGKGDAEVIANQGLEVEGIKHLSLEGEKVSTTNIREALMQGDVELAAKMLGRNHKTTGVVEKGRQLGRTLGFPTANLSRSSEGMLPVDGVYAGYLHVGEERYVAAHSVGTNDTVGEIPRLVESHAVGRDDLDLYGKVATVEYVHQVRPWKKFDSVDELVVQVQKDIQKTISLIT
ncbi:MAG: riboflavin biosynthesis protein RibF [Microbacteriaceae bacterium]|nr:riboflavin biosynthesis protein RibF [Microbacteriaceae bacterium]